MSKKGLGFELKKGKKEFVAYWMSDFKEDQDGWIELKFCAFLVFEIEL